MTDIPRISRPANDALEAAGMTTLQAVASGGQDDVAALHGMGPKGMRILHEAIEREGFGPWRQRPRTRG